MPSANEAIVSRINHFTSFLEEFKMDLDDMLKGLGQFGRFQALYFTLLLIPVTLWGFRGTEYIFTTMDIPHRCLVPECEEDSRSSGLKPPWLTNAVPFTSRGTPQPCLRYKPTHNNSWGNESSCPAELFNSSVSETCSDWVFGEQTRTIAQDFGILCPSEYWKRTLLGSLSVLTSFVGLPLTGLLSDKFGRKTVLVGGASTLSVTGILRSFAPNYGVLAALEMFDGLVTGTIFGPAFLLGLETLSPEKRLLGSCLINIFFTVGEVLLAFAMWLVQDWRILLRVLYIPMLGVVSLFWFLPESVRWLYTKGRVSDVEGVFRRIAHLNRTEETLPMMIEHLRTTCDSDKENDDKVQFKESVRELRLSAVIKSRIIMVRLVICAMIWVASIFTYYGISQYSALFNQDRYLSFVFVSLIEVPAYIGSLWLPGWTFLGRRGCNLWGFLLGGVTSLAITFVSPDSTVLSLLLFLASKFCSTLVVCVVYIYTAEVFPTELRHTLLATCSMVGRIGSILSQQVPLLADYIHPMVLYGAVAFAGAALSFYCPETLNTKLPDTIKEAENIGRTQTSRKAHS